MVMFDYSIYKSITLFQQFFFSFYGKWVTCLRFYSNLNSSLLTVCIDLERFKSSNVLSSRSTSSAPWFKAFSYFFIYAMWAVQLRCVQVMKHAVHQVDGRPSYSNPHQNSCASKTCHCFWWSSLVGHLAKNTKGRTGTTVCWASDLRSHLEFGITVLT